jgi:lysophospholipase L1-like esterase
MDSFLTPGYFSLEVAADSRRGEFDCKNQVVVEKNIPVDFVFIGDSITQMWELQAYFQTSGQVILNRGIGGDVTEYILKRFPADVLQLKPKHCVLLAGVNDSWRLERDPFRQQPGLSLSRVLRRAATNFRNIAALAKSAGLDLILCSVLPTATTWTEREAERGRYILALNRAIQTLCAQNGFLYVDYHGNMVDKDGVTMRDGLTSEGLHPNVRGYDIMARALRETLAGAGIAL